MRGQSARVDRLVRAYGLVYFAEADLGGWLSARHAVTRARVTARVEALRWRIQRVMPLLTVEERAVYYAAIQRMRDEYRDDRVAQLQQVKAAQRRRGPRVPRYWESEP